MKTEMKAPPPNPRRERALGGVWYSAAVEDIVTPGNSIAGSYCVAAHVFPVNAALIALTFPRCRFHVDDTDRPLP